MMVLYLLNLLWTLSVEEYALKHTLLFREVEWDGRYAKENVWSGEAYKME